MGIRLWINLMKEHEGNKQFFTPKSKYKCDSQKANSYLIINNECLQSTDQSTTLTKVRQMW